MPPADVRTPGYTARLLSALVVACLVLQQVVLPLHLLDHGHSFHGGEDHRHAAHADPGHVHVHDHGHASSHDHGEAPVGEHPVTDHLDQLADPTWNQVPVSVVLHVEARTVAVRPAALLLRSLRTLQAETPPPRPPRPGPGLRAPPVRV